MSLLSPVTGTARGWQAFLRGLSWLKAHPRYLALLFIPIVLGMGLLLAGWGFFYQYSESFFTWIMFEKPISWWGLSLYYMVKAFLYAAVVLISLVFYALFVNVVSSPLYDYVSVAVEKDVTGEPVPELNFWESLKLLGEELKKFLFILLISVGILFIPGINVMAPLVTAFCVGWDLYDFPLARRGWSFRQRFGFVSKHSWSVFGLGLWLLLPGFQIILMPLAVVGGTILAVEDLQKYALKRKGSVHVAR